MGKVKFWHKAGIALFAMGLFAVKAQAQIQAQLTEQSPSGSIQPGQEFTVNLKLAGYQAVSEYNFQIHYDKSSLFFVNAEIAGTANQFRHPIIEEMPGYPYLQIWDMNSACPLIQGSTVVARLVFQMKETARQGTTTLIFPITIENAVINNCSHNPISQIDPMDINIISCAFAPTTTGFQQYLDLNADGSFALTEGDVDTLGNIVKRYAFTTGGGNNQLDADGLQGDINGNALVEYYDLGWMDAVARPTRFIFSGPDGKCDSRNIPEYSDDQAEWNSIMPPFGTDATAVVIYGNSVLQTTPGGDDMIVMDGLTITTNIMAGPNGIDDTPTVGGDDVRVIPYGQGAPGLCVSPGKDGYLQTVYYPEDSLVFVPKDSGAILRNNKPAGTPAKIKKIYPNTDPAVFAKVEPIPIMVAVQDQRGRPKVGIAPIFTCTSTPTPGCNFFSTGTDLVQTAVSDKFYQPGKPPTGIVRVVLNPKVGNNYVTVSLPADPDKGIVAGSIEAVTFNILVLSNVPEVVPDSITLSADTTSAYINQKINLTITLKDGDAGAAGFGHRIKLISDRNATGGEDASGLGKEAGMPIFYDQFETGTLEGWSVNPACGQVLVDSTSPGLFGSKAVHIIGTTLTSPCVLQKTVNGIGFINYQLGYEWFFYAPFGNSDGVRISSYIQTGSGEWFPLQNSYGTYLYGGFNTMHSQNYSLTGLSDFMQHQFTIRFEIKIPDHQEVFLDNVGISGWQVLFQERFETYNVDTFPGNTMDPSSYITSGPNGICQTTAMGDDLQIIPKDQGNPFAEIIYAGPNGTLDSNTLGGDDEVLSNIINAGPNGVAETLAKGDDFQYLPVGQGEPFTICIKPGLNNYLNTLTTNIFGDDEYFNFNGTYPRIVVDKSIYGQPEGSNKFLTISRFTQGSAMESYAVRKTFNLESVPNPVLTFSSRTSGMTDGVPAGTPAQEFVVEVSDNGGMTFIPIWNYKGIEENSWTTHKIPLYTDQRFQTTDNFIIQWRATMNSTEIDIVDPDAVYIDDILIYGTRPTIDQFDPILSLTDASAGIYTSAITSLYPGNTVQVAAIYWPDNVNNTTIVPLTSNVAYLKFNMRKVDPSTVKIYPQYFTVKACETQKFLVAGHYLDSPADKLSDLTSLYKLVPFGPARWTGLGEITMDCFRDEMNPMSSDTVHITIKAVPRVPGLYDPGGGGGGGQTGTISGRIFKPNLNGAGNASVKVKIDENNKIYGSADGAGFYLLSAVPAGENYKVSAYKQNYTKKADNDVDVSAGENTTVDLVLNSGSNYDGDSQMDGADTDDDSDGVLDVNELNGDTCHFDADCDDDSYEDDEDTFPLDGSEWVDTDGDSIGDNADTDDDNDGLSDDEENSTGEDGYITDPLVADSDNDDLNDGDELANSTNPNNPDTDGDNMPDGWEVDSDLDPTEDDASADPDNDHRRNLDEYLRDFDPAVTEPCGWNKYGAGCFADGDGNGVSDGPDLGALGELLAQVTTALSDTLPHNGDGLDLDGNGVVDGPDLGIMKQSLSHTLTYLDGQADTIVLESGSTTIEVGDWAKIEMSLKSSGYLKPRSGYGIVFYIDDTSTGAGELWGGDGDAVPAGTPPAGYPAGSRYCITGEIGAPYYGKAAIWFKATATGTVIIKAGVPANTQKHTKELGPSDPVTITISP